MRRWKLFTGIVGLFLVTGIAADKDWPQWQGPDRTNISTETGLLKEWPPAGPSPVWSVADIGNGYGSVAIKGDRIYVQGTQDNKSVVHCLNRIDGKKIWTATVGPIGSNDRGSGPRGTPTVDGDRIYVLTENGDLACMDVQKGTSIWAFNILKKFNGSNIKWLISESPLVDGNNLIVTPGGEEGRNRGSE